MNRVIQAIKQLSLKGTFHLLLSSFHTFKKNLIWGIQGT